MVYVMFLALGIVIGSIASSITFKIHKKKSVVGNLRMDQSDPNEAPYLFLELETDMQQICSKKDVVLRVKFKNYI